MTACFGTATKATASGSGAPRTFAMTCTTAAPVAPLAGTAAAAFADAAAGLYQLNSLPSESSPPKRKAGDVSHATNNGALLVKSATTMVRFS